MPAIRVFSTTLLLAALLGIAACASPSPSPSPPSTETAVSATTSTSVPSVAAISPALPVAASNDYQIGPQDLLKLEVFGVPDLNRSVRVNASGQISLPLIGVVQAGGLTGEQLADDIAARLAKDYLQNPQVIIFIEEFTSKRVTVSGAVKSPGVFPLKGRVTLTQAVAQAGGPNSVANLGAVRILRLEPDGTRKMLEFDLAAIQTAQVPDPEIRGEDLVQVETSVAKETVQQLKEFVLPFWIIAR